MIEDLRNALGRHAHHFAPSDQDKDTVYLYYKDARPPDDNPDWHLGYYEIVDVAEWKDEFVLSYSEVTGCCGGIEQFFFLKKDAIYLQLVLDILIPIMDKRMAGTPKGCSVTHISHPLFLYLDEDITISQHDFLMRFYRYNGGCGDAEFYLTNYDVKFEDLPSEMKEKYKDATSGE